MAATARMRGPQTFTAGPWKGVRNTTDPFDDGDAFLVDARNCYLPDPFGGSGVYARPGMSLQNSGSALAGAGQGVYTHVALSGTTYRFVAAGGKLYRVDAAFGTYTDVTPASGVTISSTAPRVYFTSFADALIVSDGVNRPWLASNLGSTPITGTAIDYDGAGTAWSAFGQPVVYGGSLFVILNAVNGVSRRTDIAWSLAGDPATGYQQTNYDFNWTLEQTGASPLYALAATNLALYYFRQASIGAIAGTPGPSLQSTATHDAVDVNVGTLQSATVAQYGTTIFFCDAAGRPWMMPQGAKPVPIWLNMRAVVDASTTGYPTQTAQVACATLEPTLNLYLAAIWSPVATVASPPTELAAFDAKTGAYLGQWTIGTGIAIEAVGTLNDGAGRGSLVVIGSKISAPAAGGYVWTQNAILGGGTPLVTQDGLFLLTQDGISLTTEDPAPSWLDNGLPPTISATTPRLGYAEDVVLRVDRCTAITGTDAPCVVTLETPTVLRSVAGTPSAAASVDGTYRLTVGADVQGRGVQVTVQPTTATAQWNLQRVAVAAVPSRAGPDEP